VTDEVITDQVRLRLAADPVVKGGALEVDCKDGVVMLRGRVASEQARERAARLAKRVRGVKAVDSNITLG
jgi:osmotically-inducible protein OsmY